MGERYRPGPQHFGEHRHGRSEEERQVRGARPGDDQDPQEARHEGRQEDDLWQGGSGEGEVRKDVLSGPALRHPGATLLGRFRVRGTSRPLCTTKSGSGVEMYTTSYPARQNAVTG